MIGANIPQPSTGGGGISDGDKGDITVSGSGATWTIDNSVVTTAKMGGDVTTAGKALLDDADASAQRTTLGLGGASTLNVGTAAGTVAAGDDSRLTTDLSYTPSTRLLASSTGADVTLPLFSSTDAGLAPLSGGGTSNFLRADGTWAAPAGGGISDGDKGDITVSASGATWTIDNGVITNAKLADVATASFKGRTTAGTGSPEDLTGTQATALLDAFSSTLKGLAPASGGGTANFLRADGTWAAPAGGAANNQYANNNWISPSLGTLGAGASSNANNIYLYPFTVQRSITVSELGARVTTGVAASSVQLAIYASAAGEPDGAPLASTVSLSGVTATTISDNVTDFNLSEKTVYWMAINASAAITMQHLTGAAQLAAAYVIGAPTLANISAAAANSGGWRSVAQTFGTWPTLTAGATTVQTGTPRGGIVFLLISALL